METDWELPLTATPTEGPHSIHRGQGSWGGKGLRQRALWAQGEVFTQATAGSCSNYGLTATSQGLLAVCSWTALGSPLSQPF